MIPFLLPNFSPWHAIGWTRMVSNLSLSHFIALQQLLNLLLEFTSSTKHLYWILGECYTIHAHCTCSVFTWLNKVILPVLWLATPSHILQYGPHHNVTEHHRPTVMAVKSTVTDNSGDQTHATRNCCNRASLEESGHTAGNYYNSLPIHMIHK